MSEERIVSREEFLAHLHALIYNETDEPCTLHTEATVYDRTANMQPVGNLTISWFVDWTPEWLLKDKYERNNPGIRHLWCFHTIKADCIPDET